MKYSELLTFFDLLLVVSQLVLCCRYQSNIHSYNSRISCNHWQCAPLGSNQRRISSHVASTVHLPVYRRNPRPMTTCSLCIPIWPTTNVELQLSRASVPAEVGLAHVYRLCRCQCSVAPCASTWWPEVVMASCWPCRCWCRHSAAAMADSSTVSVKRLLAFYVVACSHVNVL